MIVPKITKTFEPRQKCEGSNLDTMVEHPNFWGDLPNSLTKKAYVSGIIRSGHTVSLQVPGYQNFYIKAFEYDTGKNGSWALCGILGINRQGQGIAGAYLIQADEVEAGKITLLRNSDRYPIRKFTAHYPKTVEKEKSGKSVSIGSILSKEIPSLSLLDKKVF